MLSLSFAAAGAAFLQVPAASPSGEEGAAGEAKAEIIVTGERVPRRLRETASSVHPVTAGEIDARPADRVEQLLASIPNIQLGNGSQGPAIRGLDTTGPLQALPAFLGGNRPRTTLIVDGRPATYNEFIFGSAALWDVERIEIFRSPQTTTQGQNSIAGAILVYTADPGFDDAYRARATIGNFGTRQLSALASGPVLGDQVAVRLAGDLRYSRTTARIEDRAVGADPNHDVYGTVRAKLLFRPAALPASRLLLTLSHIESQAPQIVGVTQPFRERRDRNGFYGTFRIRSDSLTASASHDSGALKAKLLLTAGDSLSRRFAPAGFGQARTAGSDWSAEAQLNWASGDRLQLVGGLSHRHVALRQRIDLSLLAGVPHFRDWQDGTGVFGEAAVALSPRLRLTAGARYQRDRQKRVGAFETASGPIALDYDRAFDALLPKVSIAFQPAPALTVGALVQKAYNPGGTTLRFDIGQPDHFEAETLWDYEAFVRASFAGGRLSVNANAFFYDIVDAQRSRDIFILAPNGRFAGFADLFNVPKAHSYGAEAEVRWRPSHRLDARFGLGLLRTEIVESAPEYPALEGKSFDRSPRLTASAALDWQVTDRLRLSGQLRHHTGYWSDPLALPQTRVPSASIVDARAEYRLRRIALFGYVRNLLDSFAFRSRSALLATLEDPREIGVGLEARF